MKIILTIYSRVADKKYEISSIGEGSVKWSTSRSGVAGKLTFDLIKHSEIICHEGDQVRFTVDDVSYFLGYIFSKSKTGEKISITCYDMLKYLKSKQTYNFEEQTLGSVVKRIAKDFQLTQGEIEDPGHIMKPKIYEDQTLLDIITDCITITGVATNKIYVLYDGVNKLCLKEVDHMQSSRTLDLLSIIRSYTYSTSIEDAYNVVKLVQPNKTVNKGDAYVMQDTDKVKQWGKLQYYEKVNEDLDEAGIRQRAVDLLSYYAQTQRTLKLTCNGFENIGGKEEDIIRGGSMVLVDIPALGDISLKKKLLIEKCTHTWNGTEHTMELEMKVYNG